MFFLVGVFLASNILFISNSRAGGECEVHGKSDQSGGCLLEVL